MSVVAMLTAGLAVALLLPGRSVRARPAPGPKGALPMWWVFALAAAGAVTLLVYAEGVTLTLGLILLAGAVGASRLVSLARRRGAAARREERVVELCETLAAELRSGQPPESALDHCASVWPEFEPVAAADRLGADVPTAMRLLGEQPGGHGLRSVAGAWQVSQSSGAALTVALTQVAETAREAQGVSRIVASELASAQATARLVAFLPVFSLTVSGGVGGEAWRFLLTEPAGLACLAVGLALTLAGLWWIEKLASAVLDG